MELQVESEPLTNLIKEVLGDKVEKVIVSDRIVDSLCVFTTSEDGWLTNLERIMKARALRDNSMTSFMVSKKTHGGQSNALRRGGVGVGGRQTNLTRR